MSRRWSPSAFRPVGRTVHPPQPSPNHAQRYTERLPRLELQESEAQEVLLQTIHGHLARLISVFVLSGERFAGLDDHFRVRGVVAATVGGIDARVERRAPGVADDVDGFGRFAAGRDR